MVIIGFAISCLGWSATVLSSTEIVIWPTSDERISPIAVPFISVSVFDWTISTCSISTFRDFAVIVTLRFGTGLPSLSTNVIKTLAAVTPLAKILSGKTSTEDCTGETSPGNTLILTSF